MYTSDKLVRFDWAIKRLLRNKADYCIVEGLLSVLLKKKIKIWSIWDNWIKEEYKKEEESCIEILAEDENADLIVCLLQKSLFTDSFYYMAYGLSKTLSKFLSGGERLWDITKIYSINIVDFSPSQGDGYVYHGTTHFTNCQKPDEELKLSYPEARATHCEFPFGIFPEYYLIRLDQFDEKNTTPLDEWISFLKTGDIPTTATAPGLQEARERLRVDLLNDTEKADYYRMMENLRYQRSVIATGRAEGRAEGIEIGDRNRQISTAKNLKAMGMLTDEQIASATGLTTEVIKEL